MAFTNGTRRGETWLPVESAGVLDMLLGVPDRGIRTDVPQRPEVWGELCGRYPARRPVLGCTDQGLPGLGIRGLRPRRPASPPVPEPDTAACTGASRCTRTTRRTLTRSGSTSSGFGMATLPLQVIFSRDPGTGSHVDPCRSEVRVGPAAALTATSRRQEEHAGRRTPCRSPTTCGWPTLGGGRWTPTCTWCAPALLGARRHRLAAQRFCDPACGRARVRARHPSGRDPADPSRTSTTPGRCGTSSRHGTSRCIVHPRELPLAGGYMPEYANPLDERVLIPLLKLLPPRTRTRVLTGDQPDRRRPGTGSRRAAAGAAGRGRVLSAPGHTPGSVAFYRPRDRLLVSGDALLTVDLASMRGCSAGGRRSRRRCASPTGTGRRPRTASARSPGWTPGRSRPGHGRPRSGPSVPHDLRAFADRLLTSSADRGGLSVRTRSAVTREDPSWTPSSRPAAAGSAARPGTASAPSSASRTRRRPWAPTASARRSRSSRGPVSAMPPPSGPSRRSRSSAVNDPSGLVFDPAVPGDDCLNLNVWTPDSGRDRAAGDGLEPRRLLPLQLRRQLRRQPLRPRRRRLRHDQLAHGRGRLPLPRRRRRRRQPRAARPGRRPRVGAGQHRGLRRRSGPRHRVRRVRRGDVHRRPAVHAAGRGPVPPGDPAERRRPPRRPGRRGRADRRPARRGARRPGDPGGDRAGPGRPAARGAGADRRRR